MSRGRSGIQSSGETLDLKAYEADMRHLIDTYIRAEEERTISDFGDMGLLDVIVKSGIAAAIAHLPPGVRTDRGAVAETIGNNVRSKILREHLHDPAFYEKMSRLLSEVLADLKAKRIDYKEFLKRVATVAGQVHAGLVDDTPRAIAAKFQAARSLQHARRRVSKEYGSAAARGRMARGGPDARPRAADRRSASRTCAERMARLPA